MLTDNFGKTLQVLEFLSAQMNNYSTRYRSHRSRNCPRSILYT